MSDLVARPPDLNDRLARLALYRWWRREVVGRADYEAVVARIVEENGWSPHYAFIKMMSAGIAVLGLLRSSPVVVIGALKGANHIAVLECADYLLRTPAELDCKRRLRHGRAWLGGTA